MNTLRPIIAHFADGNSLRAMIRGTDEDIRGYYLGNYFNVGPGENNMVKCVRVQFIR